MIVEQVDLIDVKKPAVGIGEQTCLEPTLPVLERGLQIDRADEAVLRGRDRKVDELRATPLLGQRPPRSPLPALRAHVGDDRWVAAETASLGHIDLGKDPAQGTDRRGLRGALVAPDQHAAHPGVDGVDEKRELEVFLPHDRAERIRQAFVPRHEPSRNTAARLHYMVDGPQMSPRSCGHSERHWNEPQSFGDDWPTFGQVFE
ncbi:MAG: hypothetical protein ACYCXZ_01635 [Coriobacteriia bacterium]